jgi:hypothetical protein
MLTDGARPIVSFVSKQSKRHTDIYNLASTERRKPCETDAYHQQLPVEARHLEWLQVLLACLNQLGEAQLDASAQAMAISGSKL